jgi:hypothetical protein
MSLLAEINGDLISGLTKASGSGKSASSSSAGSRKSLGGAFTLSAAKVDFSAGLETHSARL